MTAQAISPLRRRMVEDMTIRKLAPKTQASYIRAVRNFTVFWAGSGDTTLISILRNTVSPLRCRLFRLEAAAGRGFQAGNEEASPRAIRSAGGGG